MPRRGIVTRRKSCGSSLARTLMPRQSNPYLYAARLAGTGARKLVGYAGSQAYKALTYKGYKGVRSAVKKVTKREPVSVVMASGATGGIDESTIKVKVPKATKVQLPRVLTQYQQDHKIILNSSAGLQGVNEICCVNGLRQKNVSSGIGYAWYENQLSLLEMDPDGKNTGSGAGYLGVGAIANKHYVITYNRINIEVTNEGTTGLIDFYLCRPKKPTLSAPSQIWANGLANQAAAGQVAAARTAAGVATAGVLGKPDINIVGQKPMMAFEFKKYYNIVAVKSCKLGQGNTEIINFDISHPNKWSQETDARQYSEGSLFNQNTYIVTAVSRGCIGLDVTPAGARVPTYAPTNFLCIINTHTYFGTNVKYTDRPTISLVSQNASTSTNANTSVLSQVILPTAASTLFA